MYIRLTTSFLSPKIFLLLLGGLCASSGAFAQKSAEPNQEEIARAKELKEAYKEADLVALNSLEEYRFGFDEKTGMVTVEEKTKDRLMCLVPDHKTLFVRFYDSESSVEAVEVYYKNKKKKSIYPKDEYYNDSDYFYSDARVVYFNLQFPAQGYQYQVNFHKHYRDVKYLTRTFFTTYYPIQKKEIRFIVPRWLNVELVEKNFAGYAVDKKVEYDSRADEDIYTFTATELPADPKEENAPGPTHTQPHILVLAKSFEKAGKKQTLFDSTKDLYDWYQSLVKKVDNDHNVLQAKVAELIADAPTELDKVKNIYYWVQDNIRYIAFEDGIAGFKPENCQNVFQNKYGDCKGMANLTKEMLLLAGFDARLTWIGTNHIAYDYSTPSLAVDNHMICTVLMDGEKYFLDPTEKYNPFMEYAERIQGKQALIEDGEDYMLEKVPVMDHKDNEEIIRRQLKIEGDQLVGKGKHIFNGESKTNLLYNIHNLKTDSQQEAINEYLSEGDKNQRIANVMTSDLNNRDQRFSIEYDLKLDNAVSSFGDQVYLDLDYYKEFSRFKFEDRRTVDYTFSYKLFFVVETELELPPGYELAELPEGMQEEHPDFSFVIRFEKQKNKIIYRKKISVDHAIIRQKDFKLWDRCIDQLNEIYQEQIVLEKKS